MSQQLSAAWPPQVATVSTAEGPIPISNWVIPNRLCMGAYPTTMSESNGVKEISTLLIDHKIDTFITFVTRDEILQLQPYHNIIQSLTKEKQLSTRTNCFIFPIPDFSTPQPTDALKLVYTIIQFLKDGKNIYMHCKGGHGRTGTISSILLAVLYQMTASDALQLNQQLHDCRKLTGNAHSPETQQQKELVSQVVQLHQSKTVPLSETWELEHVIPNILPRCMIPIQSTAVPPVHDDMQDSTHFTFLTWNTLSSNFSTPEAFPIAPVTSLDWNYRILLFVQEVCRAYHDNTYQQPVYTASQESVSHSQLNSTKTSVQLLPDILCLQEVDQECYEHYFKPVLQHLSSQSKCTLYDSFYIKKISDFNKDGVCIFYNTKKFELKKQKSFQFKNQNQVAIILILKPINASTQSSSTSSSSTSASVNTHLVVCCTHLKAKEGFEGKRLNQIAELFEEAQQLMHQCTAESSQNGNKIEYAIVLAGDLNDIPASPVVQYTLQGHSPNTYEQILSAKPTPMDSPSPPSATNQLPSPPITHDFHFHSLYDRYYNPKSVIVNQSSTQPLNPFSNPQGLYTTVKQRDKFVQRVIDYVFFTPVLLEPTHYLSIPHINLIKKQVKDEVRCTLPCLNYPSDHLAIGGIFRWK